jgi:hypothetical protein
MLGRFENFALAAGIAFGGCAQISLVPQAIAEVHRIL